jgi:hypothetical protein
LPATLALPSSLGSTDALTVVAADPRHAVFDVRSADGASHARRALDVATGQLTAIAAASAPVVLPGMQPRVTWQVADGVLLVPVVSEAGVAVVAIPL